MDTAGDVHGHVILGQYLGELGFTDGADQRQEVHAMGFLNLVESLHPRLGSLDPELQDIVGQQTAAAAATECTLFCSLLVHLHIPVTRSLDQLARYLSLI